MVKIIQASTEGICGICGKAYKQGASILQDPKTERWVEADCYLQNHKIIDTNPSKPQAEEAHPIPTTPSSPAITGTINNYEIPQHILNLHNIHEVLKEGWTEYNLYFYIGGISVIIGGFFNVAGVAALIITLAFFYYMGKLHKKLANHSQTQLKEVIK
jgi:hypothetical protein